MLRSRDIGLRGQSSMDALLRAGRASVVVEVPPRVVYVPEFISQEEHDLLLRQVNKSPRTKWVQLSGRRLQNWGGLPHPKGMVQEKLPPWLAEYTHRVTALGLFSDREANHVLVNEYKAGEGIMPHEDGPLFYPVITTINLGSHTVLDFYHKLEDDNDVHKDSTSGDAGLATRNSALKSRHFLSLLLEPRSLVVLEEDMYIKYLHGIQMQTEDVIDEKIQNLGYCRHRLEKGTVLQRQTRVSLTIRHVPNVLKVKIKLGRH